VSEQVNRKCHLKNTSLQLSTPYTDLEPSNSPQKKSQISFTMTCGYTVPRTTKTTEQPNRKSIIVQQLYNFLPYTPALSLKLSTTKIPTYRIAMFNILTAAIRDTRL